MKKILLLAIIATISLNTSAQKMTKDSLVKIMSDEICVEISKMKDTDKTTDFQSKLGLVMMPTLLKNLEEIQVIYKIETVDEKSMYEVGKDIGVYLAANCGDFLKLMANNIEGLQSKETSAAKPSKNNQINGTFVKFTTAEVSFIEVKMNNGKMEKLFWMGYFDGSDNIATNTASFINKKVLVLYEEKEVYKPLLKDYIKIKVITKLEKK